jgi:hypothetical protein
MGDLLYYLIKASGNILGAMGIITGLGLVFAPKAVVRINNFLNKQFSIEHIRVKLEKEIDTTSWFLKTNIVVGIITLIVSALLLLNILRL